MKTLLLTCALSLCTSAFAALKVGDSATYNVAVSGIVLNLTEEVKAIDNVREIVTIKTTTSFMGQSNTEEREEKMEDMMTDEQAQLALMLCETDMLKGKLETVTVPAGTFQTCKITGERGEKINLGVVPFGIIKLDNSEAKIELTSFKKM